MPLLNNIARVLVKYAGNALCFGVGGDAVLDLWNLWNESTPDEKQKLAEIEKVVGRSSDETREEAKRVAKEEASNQSEAIQQSVVTFLTQIPATIRCSLKRYNDPTGKTLPPSVGLRKSEDLKKLLPTRLAKFKPGDTPLQNVDWELEELLGVGGFEEVWKARNPDLGGMAPVALKFCLDKEIAGTLRYEAKILNQVGKHPGIVQLLRSYLKADPPCLEYEYIAGGDLTGLIHDWHSFPGGCSWRAVAELMRQLAEIIGFAHRLPVPVIHRDLKPANVLVQKGVGGAFQLKVTDFGIGGIAASHAIKEAAGNMTWYLTSMAVGTCTPLYASPQQKKGQRADPRDDVFALGVIWYQALTGNMNDEVDRGRAWQRKLIERGMPIGLVDLLVSCFEEDPGERPADAAQLAIFLNEKLSPPPPVTLTVGRDGPLSKEQIARAVKDMREYLQAPANPEGKTPSALSAEGDEERVELIDRRLKPLVEAYLAGKPLAEFKKEIDSINKLNKNWGFKGIKGQMFFNMVINVAHDVAECDKEIKAAIVAPTSEDMARTRIQTFTNYVQRIGKALVARGGKKRGRPKPGSIPFFLSYFWQIQDRRTWPVYYTNSVNKMKELSLWQPAEDLAENYIAYKHIHEKLASAFTKESGRPFDLYDVEHVFWFKGGNPYPPGPKPERISGLKLPQVRVLNALMPSDPKIKSTLSRTQLAEEAGFVPTRSLSEN